MFRSFISHFLCFFCVIFYFRSLLNKVKFPIFFSLMVWKVCTPSFPSMLKQSYTLWNMVTILYFLSSLLLEFLFVDIGTFPIFHISQKIREVSLCTTCLVSSTDYILVHYFSLISGSLTVFFHYKFLFDTFREIWQDGSSLSLSLPLKKNLTKLRTKIFF